MKKQIDLIQQRCQMKRTPGLRGSYFRTSGVKAEDFPCGKPQPLVSCLMMLKTGTVALQVRVSTPYFRDRCSPESASPSRPEENTGSMREEQPTVASDGMCRTTMLSAPC